MNNLNSYDDIEVGRGFGNETIDLDKFFHDVENLKDDMKVVEKLYNNIKDSIEECKMVQSADKIKQLRSKMDSDFTQLLKVVKVIKANLETLERSNVEHCKIPGYGPDSSTHQTRISVISSLVKKVRITMIDFRELRSHINDGFKETISTRYSTITGEKSNNDLINNFISCGRSEDFLQKAIQDQGREQIMDSISEIQERHDAFIDIEKNLIELHQIFFDMVVVVEAEGHVQNETESHVSHADTFVRLGTEELVEARKLQKRSQKCTCITIIVIVIVTIILLNLFLLLPKMLPLD